MMPLRENTDRPLGDKSFVKMIDNLISRDLQPRSPAQKPPKRKQRNPKPEKPNNGVLRSPDYNAALVVIWSAGARHRFDRSRSDGFRRKPFVVTDY